MPNTTALPSVERLLPQVRELLGPKVLASHCHRGDETILVAPGEIVSVLAALRDDKGLDFDTLMDLCAVDHLPRRPRFEVVYHLVSLAKRQRLRVKVPVEEKSPSVPTVSGLWPGADWFEREAWDMYGIVFEGHPDLRRLLMYEQFEGHPLRRDYPVNRRQPLIGPRN
ncbi:MAG: NADH-quinone oxidoreductase subunit C [Candidatus Sumerlaeia bacterium]|nr:NADH-quinone oxidoreductase subunit C [Candidatus Sumerlaeia bacterium]